MIKNLRVKQRVMFFIERQLVKGTQYQFLSVAAFIGMISLIGGILVLPSGEPTGSFGEAVWWAFLRLSDPGYLGDDVGTWRRIVSTILTVLGYVVFLGSLVAIITSALNRKIRNLEQGLTPVAANNHIIILGWTNRTIHIAAEIFQSVGRLKRFLQLHGRRTLQLIILSDDVTPDHLQELRDYSLIGKRAEEIILRSGVAIDPEHLRRVDSLNAAAIIIPSQTYFNKEFITPDIETIKTLLTLNAECSKTSLKNPPYIVAEIQDETKVKAAQRAYTGELEVVVSNTIISRLIAQNIRHYGLSKVFNELLSRSINNNLFAKEFPQLAGKTIGEIRSKFPKAVLMGLVRVKGDQYTPLLNVKSDFIIEKDDRIMLLARDSEDAEVQKGGSYQMEAINQKGSLPIEEQSATNRILILGWNHHIPALIKEFETYEDESYFITIASLRPLENRKKEFNLLGVKNERVELEHVIADYVNEVELKSLNPSTFDSILLVSSDRLHDEEEADARTLVGYVLLEEILKTADKRPRLLLELADPGNETLIRRFRSEVLISPMILSHLLAAIALRRELNSIYNELFTVGGAEIIFREPYEYELKDQSVSFRELEIRALEYGETALGVYKEDKNEAGEDILMLNPSREEVLKLTENVQLVVLTTIY